MWKTASWKLTTTPANVLCETWPSDAKTGYSSATTPAANAPPSSIPSLPPANATMLIRGSISRMYCYESPLTRPAPLKNCCHKIGGACSAPHSHPDLQLSRNFLCLQPPCLLFPIPRRGYLIAYEELEAQAHVLETQLAARP